MKIPVLLYLYSKRLYKKVSFIVILLAMVAVTGILSYLMSQSAGMITVALVDRENSQITNEIIRNLTEENSVVRYVITDSEEAESLLSNGKCQMIWEFAEDFDRRFTALARGEFSEPSVSVIVREQSVFVKLGLEKLYAYSYPIMAKELCKYYTLKNVGTAGQDLEMFFDSFVRQGDIVQFSYYNNSGEPGQSGYLVAPLRGIIAVIVALGSLVCVLYFMDDGESGHLDAVALNRRYRINMISDFAGTLNIAVFASLAIWISGLTGNLFNEIIVMLTYVAASVGFSLLIGQLAGKTVRLAAVIPILAMLMLAVCPIFLNIDVKYVSCLLPAYWYLMSVYNTSFLPGMLIYCAFVFIISYLVSLKTRR